MIAARDALLGSMKEGTLKWLSELPIYRQFGNVVIAHAGADPTGPIENNDLDTFIWGHPNFHSTPRTDGLWIVHGHTIFNQAQIGDGRISIDTGAYATGCLTAAILTPDGVTFQTT